jgi:hypothetical protein
MEKAKKSSESVKQAAPKVVLRLDDLKEIVGGANQGSAVLSEGVVPPPAFTVMCP